MLFSDTLKVVIVIITMIMTTVAYKNWPSLQPDNVVEEKVEEIIKDYTGIDVDLSPFEGKERYGIRKRV